MKFETTSEINVLFMIINCRTLFCIEQDCLINATAGSLFSPDSVSYVTAQGRSSPYETSGFVFRLGAVFGTGKIFLGRAYGPYSRVIFHGTTLGRAVAPEGWNEWNSKGHE